MWRGTPCPQRGIIGGHIEVLPGCECSQIHGPTEGQHLSAAQLPVKFGVLYLHTASGTVGLIDGDFAPKLRVCWCR